jgi:macrolide-specific efflux system membrane fusion protein
VNDTPGSIVRKAKPGKRRLVLAAGLAVVLAAGAFAWRSLAGAPEPAFDTVVVERGDVVRTVTAVGSLQPKEYVDVGTQVSGQLVAVHVEIGDRVQAGDLIAEIDPTRYESIVRNDRATLQSLKAQLAQREAELALARQQLERNRRMLEDKAVSQDTVDQLAATVRVAEASVTALEAQIEAAEATLAGDIANLGYTKIYAPMDGTVVSQTSLEGQTVVASQQAPVIVQIANLDVMTVWAKVAEADIHKIEPGMPAWFSTLGMSERRWQGTVRQVLPTPEVLNDVVLYKVLIDVDNSERLLLPQMTVQVFFLLGEARDVPTVALNALTPNPAQGPDSYVARVLTPRGPERREVKVGLSNRTTAEVLTGLAVGERVIVDGAPAVAAEREGRRMMMRF